MPDNVMSQPIRVVIVDDSALMRRFIAGLLEQDSAIRVVGVAQNGREAIEIVEALRPDVVTMDVRMPVMDGLATTEHLMAYCPTPILVLTSSLASYDVDITFKMLGAGALEVIEKPSGDDLHGLARVGAELIRRIKILARVKVVTHLRGRRKPADETEAKQSLRTGEKAAAPAPPERTPTFIPPAAALPPRAPAFPLIVIGASTGGPRVVNQIVASLPPNLPAGVIIAQHIADGFSAGMVEWMAASCRLPIALASEQRVIRPGEALIVPDGYDLLITPEGGVHLSQNPVLIQRPSIDITMQAAASVFGAATIGVLLTGMGRDGAYGMLAIKRHGGYTIAQDEASCAIFGMPRAAIQLGAAVEVLAPSQIAPRLVDLVNGYGRVNTAHPSRGLA